MIVILHPGDVHSNTDLDVHRIGVPQLKQLYGVLPTDRVYIDPVFGLSRKDFNSAIHLFPKKDGNYYDIHGGKNDQPKG